MKILVPVNGFSHSGGMRVLSKIATELVDSGDSVDFLCPDYAAIPYHPTSATIITYSNPCSKWRGVRSIVNIVKSYFWMRKNASGYDVVLANHHLTTFSVWAVTRQKNNGFYYIQAYEPEMYGDGFLNSIFKWFSKYSYSLGLHQIVNAPLYQDYKEIKSDYVVEPGVDLELFKPDDHKVRNKVLHIACIGRKASYKGTKEIISAVEVIRKDVDLVLEIAFELPDGINIQDLDYIKLTKPHGDANLAEFYKRADIVIATGLVQDGAFHYPCLEALACGCAVITNYSPANNNNSYMINDVSTDKITSALRAAINDNEEIWSIKKECGLSDIQKFSWKIIAHKMRSIFASTLNIKS
jgi:glycosyltransferase involved in cell wall biosynthesis